jgi:hypothetical protein
MVVELPSPRPSAPQSEVDAGVIEDARRRQRRHRRIGGSVLALVATGALLAGMAAGGGGGSGNRGGGAEPSSSGPGSGAAPAGSKTVFPNAPTTQRNGFGVETVSCPLAAPNRYLPPRAGCVFVRRLDMIGDGRPDLVIVYSILSDRQARYGGSVPAQIANRFVPLRAHLAVILPDGRRITTAIGSAHTAAPYFVTRVPGARGDEVILDINQSSTGGTYAAYGLLNGRLVPAGVLLASGGDSASSVRFNCLSGSPPRIATRSYVLLGPTIYGAWRETRTVYEWRDARLVRISLRTSIHRGAIRSDGAVFRNACRHVSS